MSMIKLENVSKFYKSAETVSVGMQRINLDFELGEFVAVTGESGSGKSTLLNVISGLDGYEEGELYISGEETSHFTIADWERYRGSNIGFVFQNYNIIDSFTVYQNVLLALEVQGYPAKQRRQRALELIEKVGLLSHKNHKASKLSGGQKQRAVIARALAKDCPIIVADEPTGNLDSTSGAQVLKLLHDISKNKLVIVVTHDFDQVSEYATRKIKMHDGEVVEDKLLKKSELLDHGILPGHHGMSFLTLLRFTLRSLFSAPKRLVFLVLMQAIVMIAFSMVYTYRVSQMSNVENMQSRRFPNVTETRVLVERKDGAPFTPSDLDYFESLRTVERVYEHGLSFYNTTHLHVFDANDSGYLNHTGGYDYFSMDQINGTDAASMLRPNDVDGELPDEKYEVVIGHEWINYYIGQKIKISTSYYLQNPDEDAFIGEFEIVGIDLTHQNIMYFSDEFLNDDNIDRYITDYEALNSLYYMAQGGMNYEEGDNWFFIEYAEKNNLTGRQVVLPGEGTNPSEPVDIKLNSWYYFESQEVQIVLEDVVLIYDENLEGYGQYSEELYQEVMDYLLVTFEADYLIQNRPVASLSVLGRNNGVKTVNAIDYDIYRAIYPANIPNPDAAIMVFIVGLFTGIMLLVVGILLYSIVHAVSKNIMKSRKKDFAIFRSIGANESTLAKLVVLEQMMIAMIAAVIMLIALSILGQYIPAVYQNIQYMEFMDYVVLIMVFLLFGAWLGLRFNKRIFNQTVIEAFVQAKEE